eukprot:2516841-Rhodomonas_salina.1
MAHLLRTFQPVVVAVLGSLHKPYQMTHGSLAQSESLFGRHSSKFLFWYQCWYRGTRGTADFVRTPQFYNVPPQSLSGTVPSRHESLRHGRDKARTGEPPGRARVPGTRSLDSRGQRLLLIEDEERRYSGNGSSTI